MRTRSHTQDLWRRILTLVALSGLIGRTSAIAGPVFMGLGDLPGESVMSRANAVSADGTTVAGDSWSSSGLEAFRWTFGGGMVGLGDLPGGDFRSQTYDVSADGSIVVGYSYTGPGIMFEAFRWEAGVMSGLGHFPGGSSHTEARGVSADGSVVVGQGGSEQGSEAFRWTAASGLVGLGDLPGGEFRSLARGVSGDGLVVVGSGDSGDGESEAFRWTPETGIVGLGSLFGETVGGSLATAVSGDGSTIIGRSGSPVGGRAFRWTDATGMVAVRDFIPYDLSSDGSTIVGSAPGARAVLWDEVNGLRDVQALLDTDFGFDLTGWNLTSARDISADGTVIVGTGINPFGQTEAWVAVIPEPSSLALLTLCLWAFPRRARQRHFRYQHKGDWRK